ncbi:cAMP receptor protein [bacterium BMS3Abin07]|nr:cAMP receptor protein [bacterium BMS3Abin07]GBE31263.1 cAMP receptor protein [bacterium BMS3Bbin05]HDL21395.1 cyclic nucleotide-binding domain-containing protein [Nitrospirota bacterium]HDO22513.1 cyclic nucleotide-binding domain-containing protein [Nitrospirota bacterium]HDZ88560.1 cyclic nucleotide-binding domain-containing protein [Nitrospirota bacterium]
MMIDINELKSQILMDGLEEENLKKIAEFVELVRFSRGDNIFKEGDPTKGIYMVRKGSVEINKVTPDGWKQKLALLKENHFLGELSVVEDKETHGANAEVLEDAELFLIAKEKFIEMETTDPSLMAKIMKTIARVASRNVHLMNDKLVKLLISY